MKTLMVLCFSVFQVLKAGSSAHAVPHPFYVSVTEINQNAAEKTLEISCKFFADDLEHTLEKAYGLRLDIAAEKDKAAFDKYIANYVAKHLQLWAGGKVLTPKFIGYEREKESVYAYFEVTDLPLLKRLEVSNNLLYDFTEEQINILHVTVDGKRQSTKLNYPETKAVYQF